jgi:general secretion pathway protein D
MSWKNMSFFKHLTAVVAAVALLGQMAPVEAKTRKGDKYLAQGRIYEVQQNWDGALEQYQKALAEDPAEIVYQMAVDKVRFQAAQAHVDNGLKIRTLGQLGEALLEFQKAATINPSSAVARQELDLTRQMIERERKRVEETGKPSSAEERGETPADRAREATEKKIDRMLPVPELKPLNRDPINIKINSQPAKVLFETIGKVAGINVLWDPEYTPPQRNSLNVDFNNATLEQALDYISIITKSYWKPLSPNTIFVTNDNPNKRREYAEMVAKTFYLSNVNTPQELQEIVNAVRSVSELQRVVAYNSQNAIIVRGETDQVALAEKMIRDLDKPRAEVVVDILVLEASSVFSRQLTSAIASTGLNVPVNFTPRSSIAITNSSSSTGTDTSGSSTSTTTATTSGASSIPLSALSHLSTSDFSIVLPSALLQAALSDTKTRVLQAPQIRSIDNVKATLKIGEREPTATGSYQPGLGGVAVSALVNTQFTYLDVGVNVEITPRVNDNGDVSMHVDIDISNVTGSVNLGGINQPIIGQRKISHDIRMHEGEVNLLGGLINQQDSKQITGIPGLSSIPILRRLFSGESVDHQRDELMIALIPHIVRRPELTPDNLKGISVGNAQTIKLNYAPAEAATPQPAAAAAGPEPAAPNAVVAPPAVVPPGAPTPGAPPAPPANAPPVTAPPATAPPATAPPATAPTPTGRPASNARILFTPHAVETTQGGSFTVTLSVENASDAAIAPIQLHYDPKLLRLNDAVSGDFLASDGKQPVFTKNIQNDSGAATILINRPPGAAGVSGTGSLVTLSFQAIGKGSTAVEVPNLVIRNTQGQAAATSSLLLPVTIK